MGDTSTPAAGDQEVLLVAYSNGNRCAGLRRLAAAAAAAAESHAEPASRLPALEPLHRAVRRRPRSLLLLTPCLGHCDQAPMAALGWAVIADAVARWTGRPVGVGLLERPERVAALGQWIATTAPDVDAAWSLHPRPLQ